MDLTSALVSIILVLLFGKSVLDNKRWSQKRRAWIAFGLWAIPQIACWVWIAVLYGGQGKAPFKTKDFGT